MKTLAIIGMGGRLGMSMARRFGREGFRVGLVSRSKDKLDAYVAQLAALGIQAAAFPADVLKPAQLADAIGGIKNVFGPIDVLEYSPAPGGLPPPLLDLKAEDAQEHFAMYVSGAITAARQVLPDMIGKGDGALLFTTGGSAHVPMLSHSSLSIAVAGLRHYAFMLNEALLDKGVYAGTVCIVSPADQEQIADRYWDMCIERDRVEEMWGDIELLRAFYSMILRGVAKWAPPRLVSDIPEPRDASERRTALLALSFLRLCAPYAVQTAQRAGDPAAHAAQIDALARRFGGDPDAPRFGADAISMSFNQQEQNRHD